MKKKNRNKPTNKSSTSLQAALFSPLKKISLFWKRGLISKIVLIIIAAVFVFVLAMYSVAQWYIYTHKDQPLVVGVTFIPSYARHFDLDEKETLRAMIDDLGIKQFRLVSYWNVGEPTPGDYDFSELDWQFDMIEQAGGSVSLAIGLRQPRWPECHMPAWAEKMPKEQWSRELKEYMGVTIDRYKDREVLKSYQLENEFFLTVFGICPDHSRERLVDEYNFVKSLDPNRELIISRSNNGIGLPVGDPQPDKSAVSVYKRVWDKTATKRYFEYPFPAWFYASLAGGGKILNGNDMIIHELQTEAWLPEEFQMNDINDIPEQEKSLNAERLKDRIQYGEATGMREMYLWGVEWWYWQKVTADKPDLWNTAKTEINRINLENLKN